MSWIRNGRYRDLFLQLLSPGPNEKILDVGAGKGAVAALVQQTGAGEVVALEPSKKRIALIQGTYPNLKACRASSEAIPYDDGFFDKVYSTVAVHHFPDQVKSLGEMARVLRPGGTLLIVEISPRTLLGRVNRFLENGVLRYHLKFLDLDELTELLTRGTQLEMRDARREGPGYFALAVKNVPQGQ